MKRNNQPCASALSEEDLAKVKNDVCEAIDRFYDNFNNLSGENGIPSINQIEYIFGLLSDDTRNLFLNMTSSMISSIDERGIIDSKKRIPRERGDTEKQWSFPD